MTPTSALPISFPGRVQTYLDAIHKVEPGQKIKVAPHSCALWVWNGDFAEANQFAMRALKHGAGVKLVFSDVPFPSTTTPFLSAARTNDTILVVTPKGDHEDTDPHIVSIEDSIEGNGGILYHLTQLISLREHDVPIAFDFSLLRPEGTVNSNGMIASGPDSFIRLFEAALVYVNKPTITNLLHYFGFLNETMRRGGFKRGIITSAITVEHPQFREYLAVDVSRLPGSHKKGYIMDPAYPMLDHLFLTDILREDGSFYEKRHPDGDVFANVCEGIFLKHRGTCLISRINLGAIRDINDIVDYFIQATFDLVYLHYHWRERVENADIYLPAEEDNQIALDVMGLANLLARLSIPYRDFIDADAGSMELWRLLEEGYEQSVLEADRMCQTLGMPTLKRLHTIEPAQHHSYQTTDIDGFTTCRGIWPPLGRIVTRHSTTEEVKTYDHGPVETAEELGGNLHQSLCIKWYQMMQRCGRPHSISYDVRQPVTRQWFESWWNSPLPTKYYTEQIQFDYLRKEVEEIDLAALIGQACDRDGECDSCAE